MSLASSVSSIVTTDSSLNLPFSISSYVLGLSFFSGSRFSLIAGVSLILASRRFNSLFFSVSPTSVIASVVRLIRALTKST